MKDFLFVYRADYNAARTGTPEQMEATTQQWIDWIMGMAAEGKLADRGNRLATTGKVVKPGNVVTNGPYTDIKEFIGGYSIVKAASYDEALELAKGCPGLATGGSVEVREVDQM